MTRFDRGFICGIGYAVALAYTTYDEGAAVTLLKESGYRLSDFKIIDKYDLKTIKKIFRKENI